MRSRVVSLWIVAVLVGLGACAPAVAGNPVDPAETELSATAGAGTTAAPPATGLSATLEVPTRLPDGDTVMVQFTLTNNSDVDLYVLRWYTPLEGIAGEIFRVERDGQAVPYTGILAMRGDPTPEGYQLLEAGQPAMAEVDMATSFDFSQPGEYTIKFLSPRISHVARSKAEIARSVDDLGPVEIPSNPVRVKMGGSTDEPAGTPAGDDVACYQGASPFYPDAQPFEIDYSPPLWEYVPGPMPNQVDHLRHREIGRCFLWLGGGGEETSQVSTASLAGYDWIISQVRQDFLVYLARSDRGVLIFHLVLPTRYNSDVKTPCQRSAEDVLSTLKVPGRPLPHSMKGYELYSWYDKVYDHWYYTLITGTNRLKTLKEVQARTNVVRPDGWVSILVRETDPLKTLLQRLPPGEHVTWVGGEWLEQVGADQEMIGAMRLPDAATVAEIELFGQQAGLNLSVTGEPSPPTPEPCSAPLSTLVLGGTDQDGEAVQLILRESPIVVAKVMGPGRFEYDDQLGPEILARIEVLRERSAEHSLALANDALASFGYRLESRFDAGRNQTLYDLYREGQDDPLQAGLSQLWREPLKLSVNASGTDFVLVAQNAANDVPSHLLIDSDGPQAWSLPSDPPLQPSYVGDALAQVRFTPEVTFTYQVELDARVVYSGTASLYGSYMPLRSFTTWDDHWLLEVDDHLIQDGQDIGQVQGYDAAFGFTRLGGQSFYFFEQNGLVGISYGGQELPNLYERVFHNGCCEAVIHNPEAGPDATWFHALRDGVWYWVEAGTPDSFEEEDRAGEELALQSLVDFFEYLWAGRYEEAGRLYGGSYEALIEYNPTLDPRDHAALLKAACTSNGFQCLRVRSVRLQGQARLQEDGASGAEFRFLVEFSTPTGERFVRGPCCGASETDMPPESEFLFTMVQSADGAYRVQDLPVYVP